MNDIILPRFEEFPAFISCIKNYGRPILPPLLSLARKQEMAEIRHQAIIAEVRIERRSLRNSSLMDKANDIMQKIEKSQIDMCEMSTASHGSGDHSLKYDNQILSNRSQGLPFSTELNSSEHFNYITSKIRTNDSGDTDILKCKACIPITECCQYESDVGSSHSSFDDTSSHATFSIPDSDAFDVILNNPDTVDPSHQSPQFSHKHFPFHDNSEVLDTDPPASEISDWEENADSLGANKTSDVDDTENVSLATVILRTHEDFPNDTDSDSIITSAAQSTDLEKYFGSPGDGHFSETSEHIGRENLNRSSVGTISSDFESSATLVNSDAEMTPIPCTEISITSRNTSRCESRESTKPITPHVKKDSFFNETKKENNVQTHVRRSSYTLEKPSDALLQAFGNSPQNGNANHFSGDADLNNVDLKESVLNLPSITSTSDTSQKVCDSSCTKNASLCVTDDNRWAYNVTQDLSDTSKSSNKVLGDNNTFDIVENLSDQDVYSNNSMGEQSLFLNSSGSYLDSCTPSKILGSACESDVHTFRCSSNKEPALDFNSSIFHCEADVDENTLTKIFQNLQKLQQQQVEKLQEEQRQQWEKLHLEFQEQEAILHEKLKSLFVSPGNRCNNVCHFENRTPQVPNNELETITDCPINSGNGTVAFLTPESPNVPYRGVGNRLDPALNVKFDKVSAAAKGYLTRRLMKTERVRGIIQTIKDTLMCAVKFHEETPVKNGLVTQQDAVLHQRFISQITAACCDLHDVFFKISTKERMLIISQSRELAREKERSDKKEIKLEQKPNLSTKHSPRSRNRAALSSATIKYLERKNLRSSSEVKHLHPQDKGRASPRLVQKRPSSAVSSRKLLLSPSSLKNSKCLPLKKNLFSKGSTKIARSVRRLSYSKPEA